MRAGIHRFCFILAIVFAVVEIAPGSVFAAKDEFRTWADSKGKNKIKAKFVKLEDDTVTLEKEDGDEVEIELKKLSPADQKFAAEAAKESEDSPFKSKSDDPFKSKPKGAKKKPNSSKEKEKETDDEPEGMRTIKVDLNSAEHVSLGSPSENWQVNVQEQEPRTTSGKSKPISLPSKTNFFEGIKGLAFNRGGKSKSAVVGFWLEQNGNTTCRVALCDLTSGKCTPPMVTSGKMAPIALHDDGHQILMRRDDFGFGNLDRLEIWTPKGTKISKSVSWIPYESLNGADRDVFWASFINPETLATSSRSGKIVIWKYPEIEPLCQFDTCNGSCPALSPDRKLIGYSNGTDVGLFDVEKREVVAQQPAPLTLQFPFMAFSPSGARLGCVAFDKVLVWDVATGKLDRNIPCPGLHIHERIDFPDEDFVLGGGKFLIDLENQVKLWTYDGAEQVRSVDGLTYFAMTNGEKNPGTLVAMQIPHQAAKDLLSKALADPNLFVLKTGTNVRIDVNGVADAGQRERVSNGLRKRLEANNCKGGTTGTIDIVATVEGPKEREIRFWHTGDYKFKEYITRVKFVYQNQSIWETTATNAPFFVQLKKGENMEGHLRGLEKPNYEFFEQVQLPKLLQKPATGQGPGNSLTLGKSTVTAGGLR